MHKKMTFLLFSLLLSLTAFSQEETTNFKHAIGFQGGWGVPYGWGLQYNYAPSLKLDITLGAGFSLSGLRTGVGFRYYFKEKSGPFLGGTFAYTSGISGLNVNMNEEEAIYDIFSGRAIFLRGGYHIKYDKIGLLLNAGYGVPFNKKDADYVSGSRDSSLLDFANLHRLGGLEFSGTFLIRFGK